MYNYVRAKAALRTKPQEILDYNLGDMPINKMFQTYTKIEFILTSTKDLTPIEYSLKYDDLPSNIKYLQMSMKMWLYSLGDTELPVTTIVPSTSIKKMTFHDLPSWNFNIKKSNMMFHPDHILLSDQQVDLLITKPRVDYHDICDYCLFTINGLFHRASADINGIYLKDAGISHNIAHTNQSGILNFFQLGKIKTKNWDLTKVKRIDDDTGLSKLFIYDIGEDINDKFVMFIIGGYIHTINNNEFNKVGDRLIRIDTNKLPLLERHFEMSKLINISSLPMTSYQNSPDLITNGELYSDSYIKALLSLSQSFIVILDSKDVNTDYRLLTGTNLPGSYYSYRDPVEPMIVGLGRIAEYNKWHEHGCYTLRINNYEHFNYTLRTTQHKKEVGAANTHMSYKPFDYGKPRLLRLWRLNESDEI